MLPVKVPSAERRLAGVTAANNFIEQFIEAVKTKNSPVAFGHIDPGEFLEALKERIEHPRKIQQGNTNWCGPAAVLYALAKEQPLVYAGFALSVFYDGKFTSPEGIYEFKDLAMLAPQDCGNPVDWVTMAALRAFPGLTPAEWSPMNWFSSGPAYINHGVEGEDMVKMCKFLGYKQVQNCVNPEWTNLKRISTWSRDFFGDRFVAEGETQAKEESFKEAGVQVGSGKQVFLLIDFDQIMKRGNGAKHWVTLKRVPTITHDEIQCRIWHIGAYSKKELDKTFCYLNVAKKHFLMFYYGYVVAVP